MASAAAAGTATRRMLVRRGLTLEYLTLGWNVVGTVVPILAAVAAGSRSTPSLVGGGLTHSPDSSSSSMDSVKGNTRYATPDPGPQTRRQLDAHLSRPTPRPGYTPILRQTIGQQSSGVGTAPLRTPTPRRAPERSDQPAN